MAKKPKPSLEALMGAATTGDGPSEAPQAKPRAVEKATVYLPPAAYRRLKQMALDHDKRVNDFLREGIDMMLAKYGQPSLDEFDRM